MPPVEGMLAHNAGRSFLGTTAGHVVVPNDDVFNELPDLSWSMWFRANNLGGTFDGLLSKIDGSGNMYRILGRTGNEFDVRLSVTSGGARVRESLSTFGLSNQTVHHLTCTWDGAELRVYVDGVFRASDVSQSGVTTATGGDLHIGSQDGGNRFNGLIQEVAFLTRSLTPDEIQTLYLAGRHGFLGVV